MRNLYQEALRKRRNIEGAITIYGYGRASTDMQEITEDAQRLAITKYFDSLELPGGKVWGGFFYDQISTRKRILKRPAILELLARVRRGDRIVVSKFDRIYRSIEDLGRFTERLERAGVDLVIMDYNIDGSTPAGMLMLQMVAIFKQMERDSIGERTRDACWAKTFVRGVPHGPPPIGWKWDKTRKPPKKSSGLRQPRYYYMAPDRSARQLPLEVLRRHLAGESLRAIHRDFRERGIRGFNADPNTKTLICRKTVMEWFRAARDGFPLYYDDQGQPVTESRDRSAAPLTT